jgi:hypothetical protein
MLSGKHAMRKGWEAASSKSILNPHLGSDLPIVSLIGRVAMRLLQTAQNLLAMVSAV